jgi:hypothetical protein
VTKLPYTANACVAGAPPASPNSVCVKQVPYCSSRFYGRNGKVCDPKRKPYCGWDFYYQSPTDILEETGTAPAPQGTCASSASDFTFY